MFFNLPTSRGFLLAGAAALVAQQLTARPTKDLDFFTTPDGADLAAARDAFEAAATNHGWTTRRIRDAATFCRLLISGPEDLVVDLAMDAAPRRPPVMSVAGPSYDPEELAGRKILALFDRAEARDFADAYILAQRYDTAHLLACASDIDPGFDCQVFADMLGTLARFTDDDLPLEGALKPDLREFFAAWAARLHSAPQQ